VPQLEVVSAKIKISRCAFDVTVEGLKDWRNSLQHRSPRK